MTDWNRDCYIFRFFHQNHLLMAADVMDLNAGHVKRIGTRNGVGLRNRFIPAKLHLHKTPTAFVLTADYDPEWMPPT